MQNYRLCLGLSFVFLLAGLETVEAQIFGGGRALRALSGQLGGVRRGSPQPQAFPRSAPPPAQKALAKPPRSDTASSKRSALIIATRDYSSCNQLQSLPGTNRDADLIAGALRKGGFAADDIVVMYDDAESPSLRPTNGNIQSTFQNFISRANEGVAVIFLIGHGISQDGKSYYCPQDTTDAMLNPSNANGVGLVSIDDFAKRFSDRPAPNKLMVIDACRNDDQDQYSGLVNSLSKLEEPAKDVWILSSCSEGQRSWISNSIEEGQQHPVFTYYVAQGLEGAADLLGDNDGRVGLFELFTYASVKTLATTKDFVDKDKKPSPQTPELFGLAPPFELATVGNLVARRTLTTGSVEAEASRSADQIADDMLVNLRVAEFLYRQQALQDDFDKNFERISRNYHNYLCYLLGNRIGAALEFDEECSLAHVARGITYRATGMYAEALDGFSRGGENFDLFVKADDTKIQRHVAHDDQGQIVTNELGDPVPKMNRNKSDDTAGVANLYDKPGGEITATVPRESNVTISEIDGVGENQWLRVVAINSQTSPNAWIRRADVHWLPDAVDVYTPGTVMRPFGAPGYAAANRFDYAADRIYNLSEMMAQPARRLDQMAAAMHAPADRLAAAGAQASQATAGINSGISRFNGIGSRFGISLPYVPNPVASALYRASGYAATPSNVVSYAAGKARIPSYAVSTVGGYVQTPANHIRSVQGWTRQAARYQTGHHRTVELEKKKQRLKDGGKLSPVEARPIEISDLPWKSDDKDADIASVD